MIGFGSSPLDVVVWALILGYLALVVAVLLAPGLALRRLRRYAERPVPGPESHGEPVPRPIRVEARPRLYDWSEGRDFG